MSIIPPFTRGDKSTKPKLKLFKQLLELSLSLSLSVMVVVVGWLVDVVCLRLGVSKANHQLVDLNPPLKPPFNA